MKSCIERTAWHKSARWVNATFNTSAFTFQKAFSAAPSGRFRYALSAKSGTVLGNMQRQIISSQENCVAQISTVGECKIYLEDFMPYDLMLEESNDFDKRGIIREAHQE